MTLRGMPRYQLQAVAIDWVRRAFGEEHAASLPQRGVRCAEEAIELAQACGVERAMLHALVDRIYARPPGELAQELGGLGLTLLTVAAAGDLDAETCERAEMERVLSKPLDHFQKRNDEKNAAGFDTYETDLVKTIAERIEGLARATPERHWLIDPLPALELTTPLYGRPAAPPPGAPPPVEYVHLPCTRPPDGWRCSRKEGHDGPCAAWPVPPAAFLPANPCPCACHAGADVKHFVPCCYPGGDCYSPPHLGN